jgi:hypothetical protein
MPDRGTVEVTADDRGKERPAHRKETGGPGLQWHQGTLKKVDAKAGTLTVTPKGKEAKDKEFTITEQTKVVVSDGKDSKELTGKASLKDDAVLSAREGVEVAVATEGVRRYAIRVRIAVPPRKDEPKKEEK